MFPNPSNVKFKILGNGNLTQVNIFDIQGGLIKTYSNNMHTAIELEITESGIYFLQIVTNTNISTQKLIINK